MKTNIANDISPPSSFLAKFWLSSCGPKCCQSIKLQDSSKYNISRKNWMMKCIFGLSIKNEVKLILSFWVCIARHAQSIQNKKFAYLRSIFRKTWGRKLIFWLHINITLASLCVFGARYAESTQNDKFPISMQYRKENLKCEVYFLPGDKRQRFLQINNIILVLCVLAWTNYLEQQVCCFFAISEERSEWWNWFFTCR